ncbi:MAG: hypothetical protein COV66_07875 [Nitrospinae bacterium CG11_big_fil_rev_8_21_14_0_20_45_15]|nr:MAG: hypothetical protein COV66_07875 [Nitrospinae bacterium CG11_big_fil_rev_8_21_14_0_20_45_15]
MPKTPSFRIAGGSPPRNPIEEVVGRDKFVTQIIACLEHSSVQILAPRRLGKTWTLHLLNAKKPEMVKASYLDLEKCYSAPDFLFEILNTLNLKKKKLWAKTEALAQKIVVSGVQLKGNELAWAGILTEAFKEANDFENITWLLLDEFPIFLNNLITKDQPEMATQILDTLRSSRQVYPKIKFVLTGSIGLHWIIDELEKTGWRNPPNDLEKMFLTTLEPEDGLYLAKGLLNGKGLNINQAEDLARVAEYNPFYIQKLISCFDLQQNNEPMEDFCDRIAQDAKRDPFELFDLDNRMGRYFGREDNLAKRILDLLAEGNALKPKEFVQRLERKPEAVKTILDRLEKDGYIENSDGKYLFVSQILQRWWSKRRGNLYD